MKRLLIFTILLGLVNTASAQTDLHISGYKTGFPIAIPQLCDQGGSQDAVTSIPQIITKNLQLSGLFRVLSPSTFVEEPGKCLGPNEIGFSDWSVIGAEGLIKGEATVNGSVMTVRLYLYDVLQRKAVIGKQYTADTGDFRRVAHRFSNEVMSFFTGDKGIFGTKVAFVSKVGRFKELFIMDLDGSNLLQLTRDKALAVSPSWSPTGDKIVFTSYRSRKPDLYYIAPDGGAPRQITEREGLEIGAHFVENGTQVLASAVVKGGTNLVLFDLEGKLLRRVTRGSAIDVSPSVSPSGKELAFCSNRSGGPQIYVMPYDGSERARRISYTDSNYCTSPAWSPKGDKIAFVCRTGRGNQIFVASPEGGTAYQLTFQGNNEDPDWSPDGRYILFSSTLGGRGVRNIALVPLVGGTPTQLTFSKSEDGQPAWSPLLQ